MKETMFQTLELMWKGMFAIIIAIAMIIITLYILNNIVKAVVKKQEKFKLNEDIKDEKAINKENDITLN